MVKADAKRNGDGGYNKVRQSVFALCLIAGMLSVTNLQAAPISLEYNESVDGDINGNSFAFAEGYSIIRGSRTYGNVNDSDTFQYTIASGFELISASVLVQLDRLDLSNIIQAKFGAVLRYPDNTLIEAVPVATFISASNIVATDALLEFGPSLPVGEGTYVNVINSIISPSNLSDYDLKITYMWMFEVAPIAAVPEPASTLLLGAGLAAVVVLRRRLRA